MRLFFVLLAAIAVLFSVDVAGQVMVCKPGSVFKVECNTCRCNMAGTEMACTRKMCLPDFLEYPQRNRRVCRPGSVFKMDCNTCRCNWDGTYAACTRINCPN